MRFAGLIAAAWLTLAGSLAPAQAEKRVALVIGNDRYANLPDHQQLRKAANDARAVGKALRQIGFEVIAGENLGRGAAVDRLDEMTRRLSPGDTAFFFFSGHGVALDGVNYILPADVPDIAMGQETRLKGASLSEPYIISEITGRGVGVAVVILDACRTNPFAQSGARGVGGEKGLAPPPQVRGVFSLYAASGGQAARDQLYDGDPDPNSVFSRVLVPALTKPGLDLTALAFEVREQVSRIARTAGWDQRPAYYDETIGGRVYLAGPPPAATGGSVDASPPAGPAADAFAWSFLKDTGNAEQLRRFIAQYPASPHRRDAEERLRTLEPGVAMAVPPVAATAPAGPKQVVAQRAVLYEEAPANPNGAQFVGNVAWRIERAAPAPGRPPEVTIRGDVEIPERKMSVRLSIRRNDDRQLPASHTVEIVFTLPPRFSHGDMKNVPGILMKQEETARGAALNGLAVTVTNNFFMVGLSSVDGDMKRNLQLLKEQSWFDIPVVYGDGQRALIAIEKGAAGERVFAEAFAAWDQPAAAPPAPADAPAPAAAESGGYVVQFASQRSEAEAEAALRGLEAKHPSVLSGRRTLIRRKDLGDRGVFFVVQAGPFSARGEADKLCEQLRSAGGLCFVQRN